MKIGILTFQNTTNYGAIVQAYALNKKLNDLGNNCETINYYCKAIEDSKKTKVKNAKELLKSFYKKYKNLKCKKFIRKEIKLSPSCSSNDISKINYDCYIVGSDQVWNTLCTKNDKTFFLDFAEKNKKKFSYAASIGLSDNQVKRIFLDNKEYISKFDKISLRERIDTTGLNKEIVKKIRYDIDPVFLLNSKEWEGLCSKRIIKKKYIFVYLIGKPCRANEFSKEIEKTTGYKIINNKSSKEFILNCSPYDFLSWIYNAEYIVTNSFHGTALSIIFNKEFFSESRGKDGFNYRIYNLLSKLERLDRIIEDKNFKDFSKIDDYKKTNEMIKKEANYSYEYLKYISDGDMQNE